MGFIVWLVMFVLGIGIQGVWAGPPQSVFDLLNRVPDPPSSAREALRWFDKEGRLGHSVVLGLKDEITQYQAESRQLAQAPIQDSDWAALILGLDHVGIDAARLQTDRIYSVKIKEQLARMTIEEKLDLAQKILEPPIAAQQTESKGQGIESLAVQKALLIADTFPERRAAWRTGKRVELVNRFGEIPHLVPLQKPDRPPPAVTWGSTECQADCVAQWKDYGNVLWPLVLERETEILRKRREILHHYKTVLAEEFMQEGERHIGATLHGQLALHAVHREALAHYHQSLLSEINGVLDLTEAAAKQAADVIFAGVEPFYGNEP